MTPHQLSLKGTESGHQAAVFAWVAVACLHGIHAADSETSYRKPGWQGLSHPIEALRWMHAIPNGGARDSVTAARMRAEGVKKGIADIFLPLAAGPYHGLYIELKRVDKHAISVEQRNFADYCHASGYYHVFAIGWQDAVRVIKWYLSLKGIE